MTVTTRGNSRCRQHLSPSISKSNKSNRTFDKRDHEVKGSFTLAFQYFALHLQGCVHGHLQADVWLQLRSVCEVMTGAGGCGCGDGVMWAEEQGAARLDVPFVAE